MDIIIKKAGFIPFGFTVVLFITIITAVLITSRLPSKPLTVATRAGACGCDPPPDTHGWTDNMCFWPPDTAGCPMTIAGGYCDPNGDKSYQDADWNRGFNEYHAQCGNSPTSTPKPPTATPGNSSGGPTATPTPDCGQNCGNGTTPTSTPLPNATNTPTPRPLSCCTSSTQCGTNYECKPDGTCGSGLRCKASSGLTPTATPTPRPIATFTPTPTVTPTPSPTPKPPLCDKIVNNGPVEHKYDLIFLPDKSYSDYSQFKKDAMVSIDYILNTNLPSYIKSKINFTLFSDLTIDYHTNNQGYYDFELAKSSARKCNGDALILILNVDFHRAGSFGNGLAFATHEDYSLHGVAHELGHFLAGAGDEYDFGRHSDPGSIINGNCSDQYSGSDDIACPSWKNKYPTLKCLSPCAFTNWYRSTEGSIMNTFTLSTANGVIVYRNDYNQLTIDLFAKALMNYR